MENSLGIFVGMPCFPHSLKTVVGSNGLTGARPRSTASFYNAAFRAFSSFSAFLVALASANFDFFLAQAAASRAFFRSFRSSAVNLGAGPIWVFSMPG